MYILIDIRKQSNNKSWRNKPFLSSERCSLIKDADVGEWCVWITEVNGDFQPVGWNLLDFEDRGGQ